MRYLLLIVAVLLCACGQTDEDSSSVTSYWQISEKSLPQILEDTEFAITERNLRVTGRLHIGEAIRERKNPGYPDYEIILYCSLTFARKMLDIDPALITLCPGRITVRSENGAYLIEAPLWPEPNNNPTLKVHMQSMNKMVREIVDYAAEGWLDVSEQ